MPRPILSQVVLLSILSISLGAQTIVGALSGTMSDPSGAAVPGVSLKVTNVETGEVYTATANASGNYTMPFVKPGRYILAAESVGFKKYVRPGIVVETGVQLRVDVVLELGEITESVTVAASAPLLQSATSTVATLIDNKTIADMPLVDRRALQLIKLSGFVTPINNQRGNSAVAGGRGNNSQYLMDGGSLENWSTDGPGSNYDPPIESLQEFNLQVSNYSAEFGRTGGGVIQITTKSGTNQFHGAIYHYLRNDKLDARTFFAAGKEKLRYNLFGVALGGPIVKNKTHFFFNFEGLRPNTELTRIVNVPTRAETRGNFSGISTAVRDPLANAPFPGNIIPANRLDPVGAALANFYPEPNVPGRPTRSNNYRAANTDNRPAENYIGRVDHVLNDNDRLFVRYADYPDKVQLGQFYPTPGVSQFHGPDIDRHYRNATGTWYHNFKPTWINEFRFSWKNLSTLQIHQSADMGIPGQIGLKGTEPRFMPRVTVAGLDALGHANRQFRLQDPKRTYHFVNNLTHIRGNHTIKAGFEWQKEWMQDLFRGTAGGSFNFTNVGTNDALASLLLGRVRDASRQDQLAILSRSDGLGAFVQDDWRVTPKLTLNVGLRWDADMPRRETLGNRQNSFDRTAINPVCNCSGVVTFSGRNGVPEPAHPWDLNNFGPRVGFAWRLGDDWVVRGAGAITYLRAYGATATFEPALGFGFNSSFVSPDNGLTPAFLLKDGLPPTALPTEADLVPGFGAVATGRSPTTSVSFLEPGGHPNGYSFMFSFNIQRRLPADMLFEIGYISTLAHKLPAQVNYSISQVRPELMGPGNAQVLRPYPQFSNVSLLSPAIGNSNYHGLNLRLEKRYSGGLHFTANYTWSKMIEDLEARSELGGGANGFINFYDRAADRGLAGNHIGHRCIWGSTYELPFGKGRALAVNSVALNQIIGGWNLGLVAEARTGPPFGVIEQTNRTNAFSGGQRPNVVGDARLSGDRPTAQKISEWFNKAAFAQPAQYTFGNAGRDSGTGPGALAMDLSILKDISIREGHRLQFRTEMLNFLNKASFNLPNTSRGAANFGSISGLAPGNQARIIQLGLHYRF